MAIIKRELYSLFLSPIATVLLTTFSILMGYFFFVLIYYSQSADVMSYLFGNMVMILLLISPIVTMRLFSEEYKQGTWELLLTSPLSVSSLVWGKFVASVVMLVAMMALTLPFVLILWWWGTPDYGPIWTGYLGAVLLVAAFNSVGLFASSLTRNQVIAAILGFSILLLLWIIEWSTVMTSGWVQHVVSNLSLLGHFNRFEKGIIAIKDVYFYGGFTAFFLALTIQRIRYQIKRL